MNGWFPSFAINGSDVMGEYYMASMGLLLYLSFEGKMERGRL